MQCKSGIEWRLILAAFLLIFALYFNDFSWQNQLPSLHRMSINHSSISQSDSNCVLTISFMSVIFRNRELPLKFEGKIALRYHNMDSTFEIKSYKLSEFKTKSKTLHLSCAKWKTFQWNPSNCDEFESNLVVSEICYLTSTDWGFIQKRKQREK